MEPVNLSFRTGGTRGASEMRTMSPCSSSHESHLYDFIIPEESGRRYGHTGRTRMRAGDHHAGSSPLAYLGEIYKRDPWGNDEIPNEARRRKYPILISRDGEGCIEGGRINLEEGAAQNIGQNDEKRLVEVERRDLQLRAPQWLSAGYLFRGIRAHQWLPAISSS